MIALGALSVVPNDVLQYFISRIYLLKQGIFASFGSDSLYII